MKIQIKDFDSAKEWLIKWSCKMNNTDEFGKEIVIQELKECSDKNININKDLIVIMIKKYVYGLDWCDQLYKGVDDKDVFTLQ